MSEMQPYGFVCKNQECGKTMFYKEFLTPMATGEREFNWRTFAPVTITCDICGKAYEYTEDDLVRLVKPSPPTHT